MNNNVEQVKNKKPSVFKKIITVISNITLTIYVILVLLVSVSIFISYGSGTALPSVFGHSVISIQTDSMKGEKDDCFDKGDLIICKTVVDSEELKVDDIIAFRDREVVDGIVVGEKITVHRIIRIDDQYKQFVTRGDNTPANDQWPVQFDDVLAQYTGTCIPGAGTVIDFIKSQNGIFFCLVIPMAIFFIWALYRFIKSMMEYKFSKMPKNDGELTDEQKQAAIAEYLAKQAAEAEANKDENNTDSKSE